MDTHASSQRSVSDRLTPNNQGAAVNSGRLAPSQNVSTAEQYALQLLAKSGSSVDVGQTSDVSTDDFRIGERVWVGGVKPGVIVYIGEVHFGPGDWAGVVLDTPTGKNNGTMNGRFYFQCEPKRGVFSRLNKLTRSQVLSPNSGSGTSLADSVVNDDKNNSRPVPINKTPISESKSSILDVAGGPALSHSNLVGHSASFPSESGGASESDAVSAFHIGDRVTISGYKNGTLRFLGTTEFAAGLWAGVELDEPIGKNDGCVAGTRYFSCSPFFGLFTPVHKLSLATESSGTSSPVSLTGDPQARQKDVKKLPVSNKSVNDVVSRRDLHSPVPNHQRTKNSSYSSPGVGSDTTDVAKAMNHSVRDVIDQSPIKRTGSNSSVSENDEISRRLKQFIEKLEHEKMELYHQFEEEKRKVEDLQFTLEESAIEKSELEAQIDNNASKVKELEEKFQKETELTSRLSRELAASKVKPSSTAANNAPGGEDQIEDYLDQIEELSHKLSIAESKLQATQSAAYSEKVNVAELAKLEADFEKEKAQRGRLMDQLTSLKEDMKNLVHEKETIEKQRTDAVTQRDKLAVEKSKLTVERDKLIVERDRVAADRDRHGADKDRAIKDNAALEKKLKEAEGRARELQQKMERMEKSHVSQITESQKLIETLQSEMNSLIVTHKQLIPYKQQVDQMVEKLEKLSKERESLKDQVASLQLASQNYQQLEKDHACCKINIRELQSRFTDMIKEFESEKNKLVNIVEMTKKTIQQKDKELEGLRNELLRERSNNSNDSSQSTSRIGEQEVGQLQQKIQQLEMLLSESQTNANANSNGDDVSLAKLKAENEASKSQVEFLNSVIIEIQRKNVELESWKNQRSLASGSDSSSNGHVVPSSSKVFCDICNVHDQHDTEDCPQQEM